jgi:threonine/homoserine/homoserine lactone efflux protein
MPPGEIAILVGGFIVLIGITYVLDRLNKRAQQKREEDARRLAESEIATILERSELTGIGAVWTIIFFIAAVVSFVSGAFANTIFQQIEASLSSIVSLILFGLVFALLRRRAYTIYRSGSEVLQKP